MWLEYDDPYENKLAVFSNFQKQVTTSAATQPAISFTSFRTKTVKISLRGTIRTCCWDKVLSALLALCS